MMPSLNCRELIEFLDDYLDKSLAANVRRDFESHLAMCPPCRDYLHSYAETIRLAGSLCDDADEIPDSVPEELVRAILASRNEGQA